MFNKVQLIGRLTKDNTFKTTQSGVEICENTLALNKKQKNREDKAIYIKIVFIGNVCGVLRSYTQKGDKIAIIGELDFNSWVGKDGIKHYENSVIVEAIELLGSPKNTGGTQKVAKNPTQKSAKERLSEEIDCDDEIPF